MAVLRMLSRKYAMLPLFIAECPKFSPHTRNRGRGTWWWCQISDRKQKCGCFAHAQWKIRYKTLIYGGIAEIPPSYRKSWSRSMMVTSDFRPEVEIWPFCACAVKNAHAQYKLRYITIIYSGMSEILASYRKSGSVSYTHLTLPTIYSV